MHRQQTGSPQLHGFVRSHYAQTGTPVSRYQGLDLKAGPTICRVLGHQCDPGVLEEFEVTIHPVRVDRAELFGPLLADDLRDRIAAFSHTRGTVGTYLQ